MRQILSVSFPQGLANETKKMAQKKGFSSVSSYIKQLVEMDKDLISEAELLNSIKQAKKEYKMDKSITANSIADLISDKTRSLIQ